MALVSLAGLVAVIMAGLNERRRELAILRAVGAGPRQLWGLLAVEGALVTVAGALLGTVVYAVVVLLFGEWIGHRFGVMLRLRAPSSVDGLLLGAILLSGWLASLVPGWRAYRLSLADGLSPKV